MPDTNLQRSNLLLAKSQVPPPSVASPRCAQEWGNRKSVQRFFSRLTLHYPWVASIALAISEQPHAVLWPCSATLRPPTLNTRQPSTISFIPCPGSGHETMSPLRAMPIPRNVCTGDAVITTPPCVVLSPSRTIARAISRYQSPNARNANLLPLLACPYLQPLPRFWPRPLRRCISDYRLH